jgi:hypothetical protein
MLGSPIVRCARMSTARLKWMVRLLVLVSSTLLFCACGAYDHRWLQQQQEKQRARDRLKPATLEQRGQASPLVRAAAVRAFATPAYAAETVDWKAQFEDLLRDASAILQPALGVRLESGGTSLWQPSTHEDRLTDVQVTCVGC